MSPKRSLEHLINEHAYNDLAPVERAKLLKAIALEPRDIATIKSAIAVIKTGVAKRLRSDEREKIFSVFLALGLGDARASWPGSQRVLCAAIGAGGSRLPGNQALITHSRRSPRSRARARGGAAGRESRQECWASARRRRNPERLALEEAGDGVLGMLEFGLADCSPAELARHLGAARHGDMAAELANGERPRSRRARAQRQVPSPAATRRCAWGWSSGRARTPAPRTRSQRLRDAGGTASTPDVISRAAHFSLRSGLHGRGQARRTPIRHVERVTKDPQRVPPVFLTCSMIAATRLFVFGSPGQRRCAGARARTAIDETKRRAARGSGAHGRGSRSRPRPLGVEELKS